MWVNARRGHNNQKVPLGKTALMRANAGTGCAYKWLSIRIWDNTCGILLTILWWVADGPLMIDPTYHDLALDCVNILFWSTRVCATHEQFSPCWNITLAPKSEVCAYVCTIQVPKSRTHTYAQSKFQSPWDTYLHSIFQHIAIWVVQSHRGQNTNYRYSSKMMINNELFGEITTSVSH